MQCDCLINLLLYWCYSFLILPRFILLLLTYRSSQRPLVYTVLLIMSRLDVSEAFANNLCTTLIFWELPFTAKGMTYILNFQCQFRSWSDMSFYLNSPFSNIILSFTTGYKNYSKYVAYYDYRYVCALGI